MTEIPQNNERNQSPDFVMEKYNNPEQSYYAQTLKIEQLSGLLDSKDCEIIGGTVLEMLANLGYDVDTLKNKYGLNSNIA